MKYFNWFKYIFNKELEPVYEYEWLLFEHIEDPNHKRYRGVYIEYLTDEEVALSDVKYEWIKSENTKRIRR
jgi:hypothetical protein